MDRELDVELGHRLSRLRLEVAFGLGRETLALVGPSGAGKTTILRAVAGLLRPDRGRISRAGRILLDTAARVSLPPEARGIGMVPQHGALFPFMTVARNVAYGIRGRRGERLGRARDVLGRLGIAHLGASMPGELSGGERQRVGLARAIASDPGALLMDEPLAALDAVTRREVAAELELHLRELGLPAILVSHDFADVVGMADRVAVLQEGRIVQVGPPRDLVESPASAFVASLAGVNYFAGEATISGGLTLVRGAGWPEPIRSSDGLMGPVGVVVSPWEVSLAVRRPGGSALNRPEGSALNAVPGVVARMARVGNRARVTLRGSPAIVAEITEESARHLGLGPGTPVVASWKATATRLVPRAPGPAGRGG